MTVTEVCQKVGYGDLSYFVKLFKKITGIQPSKYAGTLQNFAKSQPPEFTDESFLK